MKDRMAMTHEFAFAFDNELCRPSSQRPGAAHRPWLDSLNEATRRQRAHYRSLRGSWNLSDYAQRKLSWLRESCPVASLGPDGAISFGELSDSDAEPYVAMAIPVLTQHYAMGKRVLPCPRSGAAGMVARAKGRTRDREWRQLTKNPDYVADWRANAGRAPMEPPPYVFRRQTEADLKAERWNLMAWIDPRHPQWAVPFWLDMPTVEARVTGAGPRGEHSWRKLLRGAGARFCGLRMLDGALVLQVSRGRQAGQIRVIDGAGFDPASSGLEAASATGRRARAGWRRIECLEAVVFGRQPGRKDRPDIRR